MKSTNSKSKDENSKKAMLKPKDSLIVGILRRWWYCMEEWPPIDYDYKEKLKENGFRSVEFSTWKTQPEKDANGYLFEYFRFFNKKISQRAV